MKLTQFLRYLVSPEIKFKIQTSLKQIDFLLRRQRSTGFKKTLEASKKQSVFFSDEAAPTTVDANLKIICFFDFFEKPYNSSNLDNRTPLFMGHTFTATQLIPPHEEKKEYLAQQIALANRFGISFCIRFSSADITDSHYVDIIESANNNFKYCLNITEFISDKHIHTLSRHLQSHNYLKIGTQPVIIVERPFLDSVSPLIRKIKKDFNCYVFLKSNSNDPPSDFAIIDSVIEDSLATANSTFKIKPEVIKYSPRVEILDHLWIGENKSRSVYKTIIPRYDESFSHTPNPRVIYNSNPRLFENNLLQQYTILTEQMPEKDRLVFIDAWNKWSHGQYLEPDTQNGYAFLNSISSSLNRFYLHTSKKIASPQKKNNTAVILHLFYPDLAKTFCNYLSNISDYDLYISLPDTLSDASIRQIKEIFPKAYIFVFENKGRDILPFIKLMRLIYPLRYSACLKIHSKKSKHRTDGDMWRDDLLDGLLGNAARTKKIINLITKEEIAAWTPSNHLSTILKDIGNNKPILGKLTDHFKIKLVKHLFTKFPAGTMFWFNPNYFEWVHQDIFNDEQFEFENYQLDGTLAHAVERFIGISLRAQGCLFTNSDAIGGAATRP